MLIEDYIQKYRANTLTTGELEEMRRLLSSLPAEEVQKAMDKVARENGEAAASEVPWEIIERLKLRLDRHIRNEIGEAAPEEASEEEHTSDDHTRRWKIMSVAAMIIGLIAVGISVYFVNHAHSLLANTGFTEVTTGFGEKSCITLPDGTVVNLSGRTTLRYPSDIALGHRNVTFDGEAYFNVSKDPRHPFIINAEGITVKVTGTEFNLYSRSNTPTSEVILDKGTVTVAAANGESVNLSAGESVIFDKESGSFDVAIFKAKPSIRRRVFGVRYDSIPPAELIRSLEERYDVTLSKEISVAINSPFTGVLPDDDIDETLTILSKIYEFKIPYDKERIKEEK